jgi:hypothetical protein
VIDDFNHGDFISMTLPAGYAANVYSSPEHFYVSVYGPSYQVEAFLILESPGFALTDGVDFAIYTP